MGCRLASGDSDVIVYFKNGPSMAFLIVYFQSFQTNIKIFVKKCPLKYPLPLGRESPPITTRPCGVIVCTVSCYIG